MSDGQFVFIEAENEEIVYQIEGAQVIDVSIGPAGPPGPQGDLGPTGTAGVVISPTPPEDKDILWADVSTDGASIKQEVRSDGTESYSYIGAADSGSDEDDPVWRITRISYSPIAIMTAINVRWTNRTTAQYN
jgi:hypothetical protein